MVIRVSLMVGEAANGYPAFMVAMAPAWLLW